ncbi:GNAT family N-acetyltransferase [Mumia zhuanghuii]|uniref:GNAT family N-acetyltransferase n=1 Tax=Mumia zhuanghuii TaxID=2585211 RepID=A0A5C4MP58_9ACTN|nr:GNAT family N-acetyltransferase [Mumia zhuanghuii]TNC46729.1 GNAT family N-acetyltransferase [Mumia zhuanghuii]TNC48818.1 GNAT family N-acetyltransferase [Mumia zhuanghuii]
MRVRLAEAADTSSLAELRVRWTEELDGPTDDPSFLDRFEAWFARESAHRVTWLAETGEGSPVGMLNVMLFERMPRPGRATGRWGYVANVYVVPPHRDAGVGGRMMEALTSYADESGLVRLVLSPTARSVSLYERAGFSGDHDLLVRPRGEITAPGAGPRS